MSYTITVRELKDRMDKGDKLFIFVGADTHTLRHLLLGAKGISTATAAVFPQENDLLLSMIQKGDIEAARKNDVAAIGVVWGFGDRTELESAGPDHIVDSPQELLELLT